MTTNNESRAYALTDALRHFAETVANDPDEHPETRARAREAIGTSPVEQPAAAPIEAVELRGYNEGFDNGWERGHVFGREQSAGISEVLLSTIVRAARKGKSYVEGYGKAHQFLKDAGLLVDPRTVARPAPSPANKRASRLVRTITHGREVWQGGAKLAVASSDAIASEIADVLNAGQQG
ncbi:hypothetical protein [Burkholderia cepacia]|uniref:hypothetical protein n=1 Tax=Burkholderia cepacia TaxID=292 RepID=UPI002AB5EDCA|nr:hypothetical protein [Burkholderia cepacia]